MSGMEPRWELSQGILLVPTALTVPLVLSSQRIPAWLLATWDLERAQAGALEAALVNGVSLPKAKATFLAIVNQMAEDYAYSDIYYGFILRPGANLSTENYSPQSSCSLF
ncbi:hypothetical protein HPB48_021219 [Haemaphysalis longicornis]|uniref:Uncharacterized protein n=1 Tax=Haemaphysalis longicornis TaxID=44386 RepID=A0A9J6GW05_HAELO|nr:hypothetical protein HPB48_021219 [Haemaphysalis longicornis]